MSIRNHAHCSLLIRPQCRHSALRQLLQPESHVTLCNLTSVSMWYVCGNKSNKSTSEISYRCSGAITVCGLRSDPVNTAKSLATVEGSHERYAISAAPKFASRAAVSAPSPERGGSKTTK